MDVKNKNDFLWVVIIATIILIFSTIPNLVGYRVQTGELAYKGIFFDPQDYAVHVSMLRAGMQGDMAYKFRYTTEEHQKAYTRLFYLTLGQINRVLGFKPEVIFEMARWVFGYGALFAIYALTKHIFVETRWQRVAFLLAVLGSGLGWLQLMCGCVPGEITPIDFWLIDAYVLFGIALFPHFAFVTAALTFVFLLYLEFLEHSGWKRIAGIASIAVITQFFNPIAFVVVDVAMAFATFAIWWQARKINWSQFAALGSIAVAQIPLLIYNFNLLNNDPIWSQFTRQNETLSPPPNYYLWGFGLLWIFALLGVMPALRQKKAAAVGAIAWIMTALLLAYAPFAIQRRFLHAITIPLALLSTFGLKQLTEWISAKMNSFARYTNSIAILIIFFMTLSNISLVLGRSVYLSSHPDEYFYPFSLDAAFEWLDNNASKDDFVLSVTSSGQLITQKTNLRVYIGHEMETLDYDTKSRRVTEFYKGQVDPDWRKESKVKWILYGPYEQRMTDDDTLPYPELEIAYNSLGVIIYQPSP